MATGLRDVAGRAGVSIKTVSNVINGSGRMSAATRTRVEQAIAELGYRPNISARNLRRGRSGVIAFAVPAIGNPYYAELAQLIVKEAERRDWTVLIDQTDSDLERERLVLRGIRAHLIDGLLLIPHTVTVEDFAERDDRTPMVLLGERITRIADRVAIDSYAAGRVATEHLLDLGRRRIAIVGAKEPGDAVARGRYVSYRDALTDAGIRFNPRLVVSVGPWNQHAGAAAVEQLLTLGNPPDALFCANDLLAHGALRALHEHGVRVPADIAVIGIDDITENRYSTPTLSSIAPDKEQIARTAIDLLAERLNHDGRDAAHQEVVAGFRLVARESTAGPTGDDEAAHA